MIKSKKKHWYTTCSSKVIKDLSQVYEVQETTCLKCLKMLLTDAYVSEEHSGAKKRLEILKYYEDFENLLDNTNKKV